MTVHWDSLLAVFLVSLGSAVAVVALVATALWGLSARAAVVDAAPGLARRAGAAVTVACLAAAASIVLFGFWVIIVR